MIFKSKIRFSYYTPMNMLKNLKIEFSLLLCVFIVSAIPSYSQNVTPQQSEQSLYPPGSTISKEENNSQVTAEKMERYGTGVSPGSNAMLLPPPPNDNCATAIAAANTLSPGASCIAGTLFQATVEAGEPMGCFSPVPSETVWYSFVATQSDMWISVKPTNFICTGGAAGFGLAVYRYVGVCPPPGAPFTCANYPISNTPNYVHSNLILAGLSVGTTYLIQVTQQSACAITTKPFCIKIGTPTTCTSCGNTCGPICIMAGAVPPTPTQVVTTCPGYPMTPPMNQFSIQTNCYTFTAPNDTINLQQVIFPYCGGGNTFSFTYELYDFGCGLIQSGNVFANNQITGLTVGLNYQICYTIQSACSWDSLIFPYVYTTSSVLPIELVSFDAFAGKNKVELKWTTASEENCDWFIIEHTRNAKDFTQVARVKAAGNSTSLLNYRANDLHPENGINYYRLRQIDYDGQFTLSQLVSAKFTAGEIQVALIPNPADEEVNIKFISYSESPVSVIISDMKGQIVFNHSIIPQNGLNLIPVSLSGFSNGIFSVQMILDNELIISRLVKD